MNIVITTEFPVSALEQFKQAAPEATIHYYPSAAGISVPAGVLAEADVLYTSGQLPAPQAAPKLKWVQTHYAGVDQLISHPLFTRRDAASGNGIQLTTASGVHAINIGEHIVMMMLALAHRLPAAFQMKSERRWSEHRSLFMPLELHGATVGLIGYGAIGRQTAQLCLSLGMSVLALRRSTPAPAQHADVSFYRREQLKELLGRSDYVVLTAPLTSETYPVIDADALASMRPTAFLVNISRGDLVDEGALIAALQEERLAGAALDVFAREPLPEDSPLWQMDNVILTPHIAGITPNYERRAAALFADNLRRYSTAQPLINQVDFARGY